VTIPESAFVFNVVWAGADFPYLRHFVSSQIRHSGARFRFVANGCPPDQVRLMEEFAASAGTVVEVFVSSATIERHGDALDAVLAARDDGEFFCFADPDILAEGPYLREFADALGSGCAAVTSGKGVWTDDVVVPPGHPGVPGECFYSPDGYLFGSPHFAMYRRAPLVETISRWGVGFASAGGGDLTPHAKDALAAAGHRYWVYDTGKIVNILVQVQGHRLCHLDQTALLHIGGMSHYLTTPTGGGRNRDAGEATDLGLPWPPARLEVARYTAALLRALSHDEPPPAPPTDLDPDLAGRLDRVHAAVTALFAGDRGRTDVARRS
jgi:hypothetical protein